PGVLGLRPGHAQEGANGGPTFIEYVTHCPERAWRRGAPAGHCSGLCATALRSHCRTFLYSVRGAGQKVCMGWYKSKRVRKIAEPELPWRRSCGTVPPTDRT